MAVTDAAFSVREAFSAADTAIVEEIGIEDLAELLGVDQGELETAVFGREKEKERGAKKTESILKRIRKRLAPSPKKAEIAELNAEIKNVTQDVENLESKLTGLRARLRALTGKK